MSRRVVEFGPWQVDVDVEATREFYRQTPKGAERCTCDHCQSFALDRDAIYTSAVRELLANLGIDYRREDEVWYASPPEQHDCVGSFYFIGQVTSGPPSAQRGTIEFVPIDEGFAINLSSVERPPPLHARSTWAFGKHKDVVALMFNTTRHRFVPESA